MAITPKNTAPKKQSGIAKPTQKKTTAKKEVAKKKSARTKYNWPQIKIEFFASDFLDVLPFIWQKYNRTTASS
jgi:hypothetical protein